ncbi:hypothetical protein AZ21_3071 [Bordetella bronchiseptica B20-10725633]|nr:hypothetical protein AZ21_3071 [Bordetella bronchiseptica B20-10725633]
MTHSKTLPGLAAGIKQKLIQQALQRKLRNAAPATASPLAAGARVAVGDAHCRFDQHPAYQQLRIINDGAARLGIATSSAACSAQFSATTSTRSPARTPSARNSRSSRSAMPPRSA